MNTPRCWIIAAWCVFALAAFSHQAFAQAEVNVGGGLRGIRLDGELIPIASGLRAIDPGAPLLGQTRQERLSSPQFSHEGSRQISTGGLVAGAAAVGRRGGTNNTVTGQITYDDGGPGVVYVTVQFTAAANTTLAGVYYYLHLPAADFGQAQVDYSNITASVSGNATTVGTSGAAGPPAGMVQGFRVVSAHRTLAVNFSAPVGVVVQPRTGGGYDIYFPVAMGNLTAGQTGTFAFTLKAAGEVDHSPAVLAIDPGRPGSPFDGVGGNFRLQSPLDPPQVAYYLDNLRVPWARVNMPLDQWQPQEDADPVAEANSGQLNNNVRQAMEMERTLAQKNIPTIITLWSIPTWARTPVNPRPPDSGGPGQGSSYHLNPDKWDAVCKSIGAYLDYAKQNYGFEPKLISFNETNIGYDVLQTPQEHTEEIKRLGAYFAAKGSPIKIVLGDVGDPTGVDFINDAMADPAAVKYIGAVSYHSWRGGTDEEFSRWGEAAKKLGVPLFVAEGGMDSDAYRYQTLLVEPWYALLEMSEYINICRLSQPRSILQWQLTENYSLLTGGRNGQPLEPAQRFWQIKQLDLTPAGSNALPITCDKAAIVPCAFADSVSGTLAVHLINNGASRTATVSGFPAAVKELRVYVTDAKRGMKEEARVPVSQGVASLTLDPMSYTTLISASASN
jgi:hypothetical protein